MKKQIISDIIYVMVINLLWNLIMWNAKQYVSHSVKGKQNKIKTLTVIYSLAIALHSHSTLLFIFFHSKRQSHIPDHRPLYMLKRVQQFIFLLVGFISKPWIVRQTLNTAKINLDRWWSHFRNCRACICVASEQEMDV